MVPWDWLAVGSALIATWLYGNKTIWGPIGGLLSQIAWLALALTTDQYGFLLSVAAFSFVHARNLRKYQPSNNTPA